jgi:hypothetical protein
MELGDAMKDARPPDDFRQEDQRLELEFSQEPDDLPTQADLGGLVEDAPKLYWPKPELKENDVRQEMESAEIGRGSEPEGVLDFGRLKTPRLN